MKKIIRSILVLLILPIIVFSMSGCTDQLTTPTVYNNTTLSTIIETQNKIRKSNIYVETKLYDQTIFGIKYSTSKALGSGVVVREDDLYYYALTNWHVIDYSGHHSAKYTVTTENGYSREGTVTKFDKSKELAVIRFSKNSEYIPLIDMYARRGKDLLTGELVFAVGNPSSIKNNITIGESLGLANLVNLNLDFYAIYHSASINPGNSGGALCDINGNLIGINTWGSSDSYDNDGFAVPLSIIWEFLT